MSKNWFGWVRRLARRPGSSRAHDTALVSAACMIECRDRLTLGRDVAIGPFSYIDASGGVVLGEGVHVASHVAIVTHSPHRARRLLGPGYAGWPVASQGARPGWIQGAVEIGAFTFVGPHSLIEAGTRIGRGSLVCAGSFVRGLYPEFVILEGRPARVVGDSRTADAKALRRYPELQVLYDAWAATPGGTEGDPELRADA